MVGRVVWCDHGWMPYHFGFCPDEAAWKREMRRLGTSEYPYPVSDGACNHFEKGDGRDRCSIITINHNKRSSQATCNLIVHECMHVWREIRTSIGERDPSSEFEAYAMQNITDQIFSAFEKSRHKLFNGRS